MITEHLLISKDDELMLLKMEVKEDDFLNSLKPKGFKYNVITEKSYLYYKDELGIKGYKAQVNE